MILLFLYLKDVHHDIVMNICFDYPVMAYKDENIPQACYNYKPDYGIGWILRGFFWIAIGFIYLIVISLIMKIKK